MYTLVDNNSIFRRGSSKRNKFQTAGIHCHISQCIDLYVKVHVHIWKKKLHELKLTSHHFPPWLILYAAYLSEITVDNLQEIKTGWF